MATLWGGKTPEALYLWTQEHRTALRWGNISFQPNRLNIFRADCQSVHFEINKLYGFSKFQKTDKLDTGLFFFVFSLTWNVIQKCQLCWTVDIKTSQTMSDYHGFALQPWNFLYPLLNTSKNAVWALWSHLMEALLKHCAGNLNIPYAKQPETCDMQISV